jgi:glyoxylase-like metal-dependent hydrolase (beta-lactamase superfamily II)
VTGDLDLDRIEPPRALFRSESGNPVQPSTWWQTWQKVRPLLLSLYARCMTGREDALIGR